MRPYVLGETNWKAICETDWQVAVLPWGATEAHNTHLPYATDNIQLDHIAAGSAGVAWNAGVKVMVLPTIPFGVNTGQFDILFDINMMPSTQQAVLNDIVHALSCQRIRKLVILNGHGGNSFKQMIRESGALHPDVFICEINWFNTIDGNEYFDEPGDHGGELETSLMLHIAPGFVLPLSEAGDGNARAFRIRGMREGWVWAERKWSHVTSDTGVGDPRAATAEKGKRFLEELTGKIGAFLVELAGCDPNDMYVQD